MDKGTVAEFDEPLVLFDREDSIFRTMVSEQTTHAYAIDLVIETS